MNRSSLFSKIGLYLILAIVVIFPVFFLPITSEFYEFNKNTLLVLTSSVLMILLAINFLIDKQVRLVRSPLGLPLLAVAAAWIVSSLFGQVNRLDAFFDPGNTVSVISLVAFFFAAINLIRTRKDMGFVVSAVTLSTGLLAVVSILWGSGLMGSILPWEFLKSPVWSPTGNPLTALTYLVLSIPFLAILIYRQKESTLKTLLFSVTAFLALVASLVISYRTFSQAGNQPAFLPQSTSWAIALESLKMSPFFGTGPGSYISDFTRFKPLAYNLTSLWNVRFASTSNYYLLLLTTTGIAGLAAFVFLISRLLKMGVKLFRNVSENQGQNPAPAAIITAALLIISLFIMPASLTTLFLFIVLLVITVVSFRLMGSNLVHEANIDLVTASESGVKSPLLPWIFLGLVLLLIAPGIFTLSRNYLAEFYFQKSLVAAAKNEGRNTYTNLSQAIRINPLKDSYRVVLSQTSLLLANSTASKKDLTDADRTVITQLIQQAIQEGKNAVSLNPTKASNSENLANIYQNLLTFAQNANEWAVASYRQAISLDPANPNLYISLGGVYYASKDYDNAIRFFQRAAEIKPNHANAYYNLSAAYREKKDYQNAYSAMQTATGLIDQSGPDYAKAQTELEDLAKLAGVTTNPPTAQTGQPGELTTPQPQPTPIVNPPIKLPAELGPEVTGTPAPSPIPSPTPTKTP